VTNAPLLTGTPAVGAGSVPETSLARAFMEEPKPASANRADTLPDPVVGAAIQTQADQASPVLDRFEVRQNGREIRLIDTDGSVYVGTVAANDRDLATIGPAGRAGGDGGRSQSGNPTFLGAAGKASEATGDLSAQPQVRAFRAVGTNLTLQQPVMIEGTLSGSGAMEDRFSMAREVEGVVEKSKAMAVAKPAPAAAPATVAPSRAPYAVSRSAAGLDTSRALRLKGGTNAVLLQGTLRLGTNAGQSFRAQPRR
jgi:hypothetical protein